MGLCIHMYRREMLSLLLHTQTNVVWGCTFICIEGTCCQFCYRPKLMLYWVVHAYMYRRDMLSGLLHTQTNVVWDCTCKSIEETCCQVCYTPKLMLYGVVHAYV